MKKRLLLAFLPALLVLSACQGGEQKNQNNNLFLEDTLAHEEIFGDVNFGVERQNFGNKGIGLRKLADDPVDHPGDDPAIGVQSVSESAGYVSFRFVAAVAFTNENIGPTEARWTRTVSKSDASAYPKDTGTFESAKAYTKLSNGGGSYTIKQFNDANSTSYTHFVVYTLRNVPVDANDYYVSAYLSLSGEGGVSLTSKAIAINAAETHKFSYVATDGAYFASGTINGSSQIVNATTVREGGNKCSFENLNLLAGDSFVIKEFYNTKLEIHGSSAFQGQVCEFDLNDDSGKIGVTYKGKYNLYLKYVNDSNELWASASNVVRPMYVKTEYVKGDWWSSAPKIRLWCVKDEAGTWVDLKTVTEQDLYVTNGNFDPTAYDYIIVARTNASNPGEWWNQTVNVGDLNRSDSDSNGTYKILNCIAVWTSKDGSNHYNYGWEKATGNPID